MKLSAEVRAIVALGMVASACTSPSPNRVDSVETLPPPAPQPETMDFTVRTCVDVNANKACDKGDKPIGRDPITLIYPFLDNGQLAIADFSGQTDDNGELKTSGPFPLGGSFSPGAYFQQTVDGETYCLSDVYHRDLGISNVGRSLEEEVHILYQRCSPGTTS